MTISAANIQAQDVRFEVQLDGRTWSWKTRVAVAFNGQTYQIVDIQTPYGFLRDSIPLPGPIVQEMSQSIDTLKSNYKSRILIGPPTALTVYVDEGRGFTDPASVPVTNSGVFGSFLSATLASSAAYLETTPTNLGLAMNQSGSFDVLVDSTSLIASQSPYHASITVQDVNASNSPQVLPVTIMVRPKAVISVTPTILTFTVAKPLTGPFPVVASQNFTVQNTGSLASFLDYQITRLTGLSKNWLQSFTPFTGTLDSTESATITVTVAPNECLLAGIYTETLRISGYSSNNFVDVTVQLTIT